MKIIINNDQILHVSLKKVSDHLMAWYDANKHNTDTILMDNGRKMDFSRKSIARIAMKTAMVPIVIPAIKMLYAVKKKEAPQKEKHADLLDYAAMSLLGFIGELDGECVYVETMASGEGNEHSVISISTIVPVRRDVARITEQSEDKKVSSRGETCVYSGEVGNGENVLDKGIDQEEIGGATVVERLSP